MNVKTFPTFLLLISLILFSCEEEKKPDYLLKPETFTNLIVDFQKAEAYIRFGYNRNLDSVVLSDSVYAAVFRKHEVTQSIFDSNFNYYSNRPAEFEKIFDEVIVRLSETSAKLSEGIKELPTNQAVEKIEK